ncbi:Tex family protein [Natronospira proteinivora]
MDKAASQENITHRIAEELGVRPAQVNATVKLLDDGATVPFIARYRKEVTGSLDDTQLRELEQRLGYLRELEERRATILESIAEQEKLTPELEKAIKAAENKTRLEDLYLPYKKKRRTKGQMAIEAGLEPLADQLFEDPSQNPEALAADYVDADSGYGDTAKVLEGARAILSERWAEDAELVGRIREWMQKGAWIESRVVEEKRQEGSKFRDYFEHAEPLAKIPSHRFLALLRGRNEGILRLDIVAPDQLENAEPAQIEAMVARHLGWSHQNRAADDFLADAVRFTGRIKILVRLETELTSWIREQAEEEAIQVFAGNMRDLLLAAPAGEKTVLGLDPGLRTGSKVAVVDTTGKLVETATIYPHAPQKQWQQSLAALRTLVERHGVNLIAIGNGTASRETEKLIKELTQEKGLRGVEYLVVSEAGASVYSASEAAAKEFPNLDVSLRGAVSIARRVQDPLAELVKIEPKSIGVGQYQHDVSQVKLGRSLEAVVEDCVNAVGVDANTASAALLSRVSGLSQALAENLVRHRDENGPFSSRKQLKKIYRFGDKAFEQAAGFLRIRGDHPLDASSVHPEAYPVVEKIRDKTGRELSQLIGDEKQLKKLDPQDFTDERFGVPTVEDILKELEKPGRDPRPEFRTVQYREGVEKISDLEAGMKLEGVVTNVTNFGAFVDVGVHQDGLVHISQLADKFVKDPRDVVKPGDIVSVRVMEVDVDRKRIGLSMRSDAAAEAGKPGGAPKHAKPDKTAKGKGKGGGGKPARQKEPEGALAMALKEKLGK